jgi:ComF family protein
MGTHQLCADCFTELEMVSPNQCAQCGIPFEITMPAGSLCIQCIDRPPHYDEARAVCLYNDLSRQLIARFKYYDQTQLAPFFGQWLRRSAGQTMLDTCDIVAPIPLHRKRLWQRRYNQALLMARAFTGAAWHGELIPDLLIRTRHTEQQTGKKRTQRQQNVRGAFTLHARYDVKGKHILLMDDVMTTGATADACAKALKKAGAARVSILTFARTGLD